MRSCLFFVCGLAFATANIVCHDNGASFPIHLWPYCTVISEDMVLYSSDEGDFIKLGLHAASHTTGWSAVALAGNGGMKGADEIVVRQEQGEWVAEDRHSDDYNTPALDVEQRVRLLFASQTVDEGTQWAVLLPKDSCDEKDYRITDVNRYMLWALGNTHSFGYHATRGQFHANLVSGTPAIPEPEVEGAIEMKILMPNAEVKLGAGGMDQSNPYLCGIFDLSVLMPNVDWNSKVHVAKMVPELDPASEQYAHHMILYACDSDLAKKNGFTHNTIIDQCESMPPGCESFKWPWAIGGNSIVFPDGVGLPLGEGQNWVALQMHYYNPSLHTGVRDSSGVSLFVLPKPRAQDAGFLTLNGGTHWSMRDPMKAGVSELTLSTFVVPSECTESWSAEGLTVLGAAHHQHLLGKTMSMDITRNGEYLGRIRDEKRYDFNHQSLEESAVRTLLPGDEFTVTCTYDTRSAKNPVEFGDLTQNEMCYGIVLYYPRQVMSDPLMQKPGFLSSFTHRTYCKKFVSFTPSAVDYGVCTKEGNVTTAAADLVAHSAIDAAQTSHRSSTGDNEPSLTHRSSTGDNEPSLTHRSSTGDNEPSLNHRSSTGDNDPFLSSAHALGTSVLAMLALLTACVALRV